MTPTDFEKHIKRQLLRVSHLLGYPTESVALRDYVAALSTAGDEKAATRVMDQLVGEELERCPSPATIRRIAYDLRQGQHTRQAQCYTCDGAGYVTIWKLVTYVGKSFKIRHAEIIPVGQARELAERIAAHPIGDDNQQVLSAAKECECRKMRPITQIREYADA